jgi:type I restriction enzyme S subunit
MVQKYKSGWKLIKLKEVCQEITVGHVGPMAKEYISNGIPFLRSQNILPFRLDLSSVKFITPEFHKKLRKSALKPGDVIVVRTGYPGTACVVPPKLSISNCADLVIIKPSSLLLDPYYLTYIFNSAWGRTSIAGNLVGVAQQHFNISAAKEMLINLPPLPTQQKIASILSAYDDLIENNTRRIAILKEMAQALYREWFVHFRFPGHEKNKMVESVLGMIPEGWDVLKVGDISISVNRGVSPKYDNSSGSIVLNQRCIRNGKLNLEEARKHSTKVPPEKLIRFGDVVINSTGTGTLGRVTQIYQSISDCTVDSHITIVRPRSKVTIDYFGLTLINLQAHFESLGVGSTGQTELSRGSIANTDVLLPPKDLQENFSNLISPMQKNIIQMLTKNANLRRTRDLLLPRLISGEIDVEGLEIEGEEMVEAMEKEVEERRKVEGLEPALVREQGLWGK